MTGSQIGCAVTPVKVCGDVGGVVESAGKRRTKDGCEKLHGCGCEREVYTKGTALAGNAVHGHPTTMYMSDMLDDGQAKAGSAKFPGAHLVHAVEPLENPVRGGNRGNRKFKRPFCLDGKVSKNSGKGQSADSAA